MGKNSAHNLLEVKVLIEEAFSQGNEYIYQDCNWFTHDGQPICKSVMGLVGYYLEFDGYSTYKEL